MPQLFDQHLDKDSDKMRCLKFFSSNIDSKDAVSMSRHYLWLHHTFEFEFDSTDHFSIFLVFQCIAEIM